MGRLIHGDTAFIVRLDADDGKLQMTVRFSSIERNDEGPYGHMIELNKSLELLKPSLWVVKEEGNHRKWLRIMPLPLENVFVNGRTLAESAAPAAPERPLQGVVLEKRAGDRVLVSLGADADTQVVLSSSRHRLAGWVALEPGIDIPFGATIDGWRRWLGSSLRPREEAKGLTVLQDNHVL